ncbi:unnamed protein product [Moneuplotes crassus]|uniref:Uncharacterized protein n=1 Tax=Euplotes crassus TaxID=5936 RepID=A0AAD1XWK4_EUPCR|nr:unnamed protein product [Moneuplotes crassus]
MSFKFGNQLDNSSFSPSASSLRVEFLVILVLVLIESDDLRLESKVVCFTFKLIFKEVILLLLLAKPMGNSTSDRSWISSICISQIFILIVVFEGNSDFGELLRKPILVFFTIFVLLDIFGLFKNILVKNHWLFCTHFAFSECI